MASIESWRYKADGTGWGGEAATPTGSVSVSYSWRSRIKISLGGLDSTYKRSTLTLNISNLVASFSSSQGVVTARLTNADASAYEVGNGPFGTIIASDTCTINQAAAGSNIDLSFTFDISGLGREAQTLYIYLSNEGGYYYELKAQSATLSESPALAITSVRTGNITSSTGQIFLPSGQVTVSWSAGGDGVGNPISSYTAYIKVGGQPTTSSYTLIKTGISKSATSYTFTLNNAARGQSVWVGIQAIGSVSGYNGAFVASSSAIGAINVLPNAPTITGVDGTQLTYAKKIKYTVSAGADTHTVAGPTLYYSIGSGGKTKFTSPLTISLSSSFKHGSNTLNFYTYDGLEYSSATSHTFTASFNPIIKGGTPKCTHTMTKNMSGASVLTTSSTITFDMDGGTAKGVTVSYRNSNSSSLSGNGNILSSSYYNYNSSTRTITINIMNIPTSIIGYGQYFDFSFTVTDGTYTSDTSGWLSAGRRPKLPGKPTLISCTTDLGTTTANGYFKQQISVKWKGPAEDAGCVATDSMQIIATHGNTSSTFDISKSPHNITLSDLTANTEVTLKVKVKDKLGNTNTSESSVVFIKIDPISFVSSTNSIAPTTLRPLSAGSVTLQFVHSKATFKGGSITYDYFIKIGDTKTLLDSKIYEITTQGEQITLSIPNAQKEALKNLLIVTAQGRNNAYAASFIVTASDGYGESISQSKTFTVEFREAPVFNNNNFDLLHDYKIGRTSPLPSVTGSPIVPKYDVFSSRADKDIIMFNSGEGLIFKLPRATDPNNDISKYQIFISRNDLPSSGEVQPASSLNNFESWLPDLSLESLKLEDDYYYYRFDTSSYSKNQYFYFKVQVVDSWGNVSDPIVCDKCIIGCRTASPKISVTSGSTLNKVDNKFLLKYSLRITDLGGSATKDGWDRNFYLNFRNYERDLKVAQGWNFTPTLTLYVDISDTSNFNSYIRATQQSTSNLCDFASSSISFYKDSNDTTVWNNIVNASKVFVRFRIRVAHSISGGDDTAGWSYVYSSYQSQTIFMAVPTVAHRVNSVGVNTKTVGEDQVLLIENFEKKRYVVLKGVDGTTTGTITIDLVNGTMTGATLDCGSW